MTTKKVENSLYTFEDTVLFMTPNSEEGKRYVKTLRDLPNEEKPREKLAKYGPAVLSVNELLAVVLNVGTKKEEVLHMATRVVQEYGERSLASQRNPKQLSEDLDIPLGKAAQIVACAELGRRFFQRNKNGLAVLRTAKDVFQHVKDMRNTSKEHLRGLYLDAHYRVIHDEIISIGTVDASIIHPREFFKPALEHAAAGAIAVHNHPSGVAEPSKADIEVTNQLTKAGTILGIDLVDHVIVTEDAFMSIYSHEGEREELD